MMNDRVHRNVDDVLSRAGSFLSRHRAEPHVEPTFKYFTDHPVAPLNRKRLGLLLDAIERLAAAAGRPLRVLDLACGAGIVTCAVSALGHRTHGLDLCGEEVALARRFAEEERLAGDFAVANLVEDPDWEQRAEQRLGGRPDVVILAYALHHLPRVEDFVARLGRWLQPGACLVINEENPLSPMFRLKHVVRTILQGDTDTEWHRTHRAWKNILDARGFDTSRPRGADMAPWLDTLAPGLCWSLVFTARRGGPG